MNAQGEFVIRGKPVNEKVDLPPSAERCSCHVPKADRLPSLLHGLVCSGGLRAFLTHVFSEELIPELGSSGREEGEFVLFILLFFLRRTLSIPRDCEQ